MQTPVIAVLGILALFPAAAFGQDAAEAPIKTTLCELVKNPAPYNEKMVEFRATFGSGFEASVLKDETCSASIWLAWPDEVTRNSVPREWAYMQSLADVKRQDQLEWHPQIDQPPTLLRKDKDYERFTNYIGEQFKPSRGGICIGCPIYQVTVTAVGRFEHAEGKLKIVRETESHKAMIGGGGFGHLGGFESQLILESVSEVVAKKLDPPAGFR